MVPLQQSFLTVVHLCVFLLSVTCNTDPVVTLKHGGQLQGISYPVGDQRVDHFVSVRYAKSPVGELRFKKPEPADPWTGVELAQKGKGVCLQYAATKDLAEKIEGHEDCLFLDVVVPRGVSQSNSGKPVMIWIHGGGYFFGHRMQYIPAVLAAHGDVIVVTINYRVGIFGFLSDRLGNGNFALWDQRAAIMWVKDNIGSFGGDPDKITLFGESAGGGSVAAQMMGQHNDDLFQRGIAQSGSMYMPWGWYLSAKNRDKMVNHIREELSCEEDVIYDCYKDKTGLEVLKSYPADFFDFAFHPDPDNDFFPPSVQENSYELSRRFDLMAGFNGMEGIPFTGRMLSGYLAKQNKSLEDGCSAEDMQSFLELTCSMMVSGESPELCAHFITKEYGIDEARDNVDRLVKYTEFAGEFNFIEDSVRLLKIHSTGEKATFGYQFMPYVLPVKEHSIFDIPEEFWTSSTHLDEIPFMLGYPKMTDEMLKPYSEFKDDHLYNALASTKDKFLDEDLRISDQAMTLWTNFAKSGNPNKPVKVEPFPDWPQYSAEDSKLMKIDYTSQPIGVPHKERMERMRAVLLQCRNRRVKGDDPVTPQLGGQKTKSHDEL